MPWITILRGSLIADEVNLCGILGMASFLSESGLFEVLGDTFIVLEGIRGRSCIDDSAE